MQESKNQMSADEINALFDSMVVHDEHHHTPPEPVPAPAPAAAALTRHTPHEWLDAYIERSRKLSPRAFDFMHEMCGIFVLSAAVAGRARLVFGGAWRGTAIMVMIVAPSSRWAKSHTVRCATDLIKAAGLGWRGLPSKATPQAVIGAMSNNQRVVDMARSLDGDLDEKLRSSLEREMQEIKEKLGPLLANEGQRWWHISEFGTKIIDSMRSGGVNSDFSDFFRDINGGGGYGYLTRSFGEERIEHSYLAVISDTTPVDLLKYSQSHAQLWSNGFFPRFTLVTPTDEELEERQRSEDAQEMKPRVPYGTRPTSSVPGELVFPINALDEWLGGRSSYDEQLPQLEMKCSKEVDDAFYMREYRMDIAANPDFMDDLGGSYMRMALEQNIAIAMLLALVEGSDEVLMRHAMRAEEITERARLSLEAHYRRMTGNLTDDKTRKASLEEQQCLKWIVQYQEKSKRWPTASNIRTKSGRSTASRWPISKINEVLTNLSLGGVVESFEEGSGRRKVTRWQICEQ